MARRIRSSKLQNRTNRLKLEPGLHRVQLAPSLHLAYRKPLSGAGTWSLICKRKPEWMRKIGIADDHENANGETVLDFAQACEQGLALGRAGEGNGAIPSVLEAVEAMEAELIRRGGSPYNATTLKKKHLPAALAGRSVALLKSRDLTEWWAAMLKKGLKPSSVERIAKSLASALNRAADEDPNQIKNRKAWREGLKPEADGDDDAEIVRDGFILSDSIVGAIVRACQSDDDFGLLIHIMAETGCRESQAFKLKVQHLHDGDQPTLLMPTSRKGSNRRKARRIEYRPVPISPALAALLRQKAIGRSASQPLLTKVWDVADRFRPVIESLGLDASLTPYCLRYSSIARQLLKGMPMRVVASNHDTSTAVIEAFYSRHIAKTKEADAMTRAALIDLNVVAESKVIAFPASSPDNRR